MKQGVDLVLMKMMMMMNGIMLMSPVLVYQTYTHIVCWVMDLTGKTKKLVIIEPCLSLHFCTELDSPSHIGKDDDVNGDDDDEDDEGNNDDDDWWR